MNIEKKTERIIFILPKAPIPLKGRIGKTEYQDWYQAVLIAVRLIRSDSSSKLLLVTSFACGDGLEMNKYLLALDDFKIEFERIYHVRRGLETVSQLTIARNFAANLGADLTIICVASHYFRVKYLCWKDKINAEIKVAYGIPTPWGAFADVALTFAFPIVDLFGRRDWFLRKVNNRRNQGRI